MTTTDDDPLSDEERSRFWQRRWETIHRIKLSVLYHHKRERFFDGLEKFMSAVTAVAATSAVSMLYQSSQRPSGLELWVAAVTAALSIATIVYSPSSKARHHGQLAAEMRRLWADCEGAGEHWDELLCNQFAARVLQAEVGETAQLGALVVQCENEICVAAGQPENIRELGFRRTLLMHWWNFDPTKIPRIKPEKVQALYGSAPPQGKSS